MRKLSLSLALSVGVALAGCATLMPVTPAPGPSMTQPAFEPGDLAIALRIGDSRTLQAPSGIPVYDASSVDKLEIIPMLKVGNDFLPVSKTTKGTVNQGSADQLMMVIENVSWEALDKHRVYVLKNLAPNSTYRVQVKAYDSQGTQISKDETSFGDVVVATADRPQMIPAPVPLELKDKPFQARVQVDLSFAGGNLGETRSVVLKLMKKVGAADVPVGLPQVLSQNQLSNRRITLAGLAPQTDYTLHAEAFDAADGAGTSLATATLPIAISNLPDLGVQQLELALVKVETFAGGGVINPPFTNADRLSVRFPFPPNGIVTDAQGTIYVTEKDGNRLHRIDPTGKVTSWKGIAQAMGMAFDSQGNLYLGGRACIWKIPADGGTPVVFAGMEGLLGTTDATGTAARFNIPRDLCFDAQDNLYVVDFGNNNIRKVTPGGVVTTFAGANTNVPGSFQDGTGTAARFDAPYGITIDRANQQLYVADTNNHRIRKVDIATREVTTFAGAGAAGSLGSASIFFPRSVAFTAKGLYVGDEGDGVNGRIYRIANGQVGAPFSQSGLRALYIAVETSGSLLVGDFPSNRILRIQNL
jgi:Gluconolactonase